MKEAHKKELEDNVYRVYMAKRAEVQSVKDHKKTLAKKKETTMKNELKKN